MTVDVRRIAKGKFVGRSGRRAFSANAPWPTSLRDTGPLLETSFVANDGKV